MIIAIDGPAAAGKGTLARRLAKHLGLAYLESGKLYRAVALKLLRQGLDPSDRREAAKAAGALAVSDLDDPALLKEATAKAASIVAAIPEVRAALLAFQHHFAAHPPNDAKGVVIDGRDIGTVVCPHADHKFFVTANTEVRAVRRLKQLRERGAKGIHSRVLKHMKERDARDSGREISPLVPAPDAHLLDTSEMDADEVFAAALEQIER
ncbi:MAG: (d)CMP kinase [Alphaproteobacteria bacterium]